MKKFLLLFLVLSSCKTPEVIPPTTIPVPPIVSAPAESISLKAPLSWEKNHPERKAWSDTLLSLMLKNDVFESLSAASDILKIRSDFNKLNKSQQLTVLCELISSISYYESSWDPRAASVDVGTKDNKDTYSIGLMQISVVDQANYGIKLGYDYNLLLTPGPNLDLATRILAKQVQKYGHLMIAAGEKGLYWAVLHPGGKYDQSASIIKTVQNLKFD